MIDFALTIGINQYGHGNDLSGCVNDCLDWTNALKAKGAQVHSVIDAQATKANMVALMREMVSTVKRGQLGVICYSGHGTWVPDFDGDEIDHRDEALCPVDVFDTGEVLTDDELLEIFTRRAYGARLVLISDSCHSGTVARFAGPLLYHVVDRKATKEGWDVDNRPIRQVRFLPPANFLSEQRAEAAKAFSLAIPAPSRTSALLLAGCRDTEYSYDAWFPQRDGGQRANGAFTRVAIDALTKQSPISTFADWHAEIRRILPSQDYPQTPQLTGKAAQKRWPIF